MLSPLAVSTRYLLHLFLAMGPSGKINLLRVQGWSGGRQRGFGAMAGEITYNHRYWRADIKLLPSNHPSSISYPRAISLIVWTC